jgi:glutamyl-tRNA synthetase
MWARRASGRFLLRFEDTDTARSSAEYEDSILEDLRWLGMEPDGEIARQTSNSRRHKQVLADLRKSGSSYPCFCADRGKDDKSGILPRCVCGRLSDDEAEARMDSGEPHCWRFRIREDADAFRFSDRLRGTIEIPTASLDDFVLTRGDGTSTYIFAVVVDDHDSSVTHVIRGDEHISNTPRQEMIYRALGWRVPQWAHIPMVLDAHRRKLSKRSGAISIGSYRSEGWLPEAVISYIATLSWAGAPSNMLISPTKMSHAFRLDSVALTPPVHDPDRMRHFGRMSIAGLPPSDLLKRYWNAFPERFPDPNNYIEKDRISLIKELVPSCATLGELDEAVSNSFAAPQGVQPDASNAGWIMAARDWIMNIDDDDWTSESIGRSLKEFQRERGLKGRELYHTLRLLITGRESGAPLFLILSCLGREMVTGRLEAVLKLAGDP